MCSVSRTALQSDKNNKRERYRLQRWLRDKAISFVPPDGRFVLMDYRYSPVPTSSVVNTRHLPVPFSLVPSIKIEEHGGAYSWTMNLLQLLNPSHVCRLAGLYTDVQAVHSPN